MIQSTSYPSLELIVAESPVGGPCIHPFLLGCVTRYARENRIKKLLSSLKLADSRRKIIKRWNTLVQDFGGECGLCRHTFKRCGVEWIEEDSISTLPQVTEEEIFIYIPYDFAKRTYALQIWGYDENVVLIEEDDYILEENDERDDGMDDGNDDESYTVRENDDVVELVAYSPAPTTTPQHREVRARLISNVHSLIQRQPNRNQQHLHLRMQRLREQG